MYKLHASDADIDLIQAVLLFQLLWQTAKQSAGSIVSLAVFCIHAC